MYCGELQAHDGDVEEYEIGRVDRCSLEAVHAGFANEVDENSVVYPRGAVEVFLCDAVDCISDRAHTYPQTQRSEQGRAIEPFHVKKHREEEVHEGIEYHDQ